uniref:Uncharacterized protein n=1 Tax=Anguilla anguilla TaxID=7936 RepID=A0A0E9SDE7_ANGAN
MYFVKKYCLTFV